MSTYSPSLRIELITTGDQAGTWGTTTNTNMGTLIESAIAGYTSVSVTTANQALTALNGAADQSRNMTIALTTTTTAAFSVYAPPAEKTYIVYNASLYTATIYNSTVLGNTTAAGAGVSIPAGKTMTVWSDGTNFALQNTQFEGTSTTQAFGTNNTALATTAFVQAALQALHPVGSIYMNATNANNPSTYLGFGTWTAFGAGRVPVGFNASNPLFDTAEETGGSYDATLPAHTHTGSTGFQSDNHSHTFSGTTTFAGDHQHAGDWPNDCTGARYQFGTSGVAASSQFCDSNGTVPYSALTNSAGSHTHTYSGTTSGVSSNHYHDFTTASAGSSATNANIQPYITVYMWKRTA
jgi:hypothetical protein